MELVQSWIRRDLPLGDFYSFFFVRATFSFVNSKRLHNYWRVFPMPSAHRLYQLRSRLAFKKIITLPAQFSAHKSY